VALNNLGLGFVFTARDLASGAIGAHSGQRDHPDRPNVIARKGS